MMVGMSQMSDMCAGSKAGRAALHTGEWDNMMNDSSSSPLVYSLRMGTAMSRLHATRFFSGAVT
jgi:hypothetical protein